MQDTVDQAPATARTLADIIARSHLPSHPPSVGVYDPDPEHAGDPADRIDTRRRQVMGSPAGL
jgi:hypothetical protein